MSQTVEMTTPTGMTDAELKDALDGLFAYDTGCVDSGTRHEMLRRRVIAELEARRGPHELIARVPISQMCRDLFLSEESIAAGYGIEDVMSFIRWLNEEMGFDL